MTVIVFVVVWAFLLAAIFAFQPRYPDPPEVELSVISQSSGYKIEISDISESKHVNDYRVAVLKDGLVWFDCRDHLQSYPDSYPIVMGTGPTGEYLNFTNLMGGHGLTRGDYFTLESLTSGSEYEFTLFWRFGQHGDQVIASALVEAQ